MSITLDWRQINPYSPYVDGVPIVDWTSRSGNQLSFQINMAMKLGPSPTGYWNYPWYLDWICGSVSWYGALAKDWTNGHFGQIIYMSDYSGHFIGTTTIGGKDTYFTFSVQHHDSAGHWGSRQYYSCPIPRATAPSKVTVNATNVSSDSVTINASTSGAGAYANMSKWTFTCGGQTKTVSTNQLSASVTFDNLDSSMSYTYKATATNSVGYSTSASGSFRTKDDIIGQMIKEDGTIIPLRGWIVTAESKKRIKQVSSVGEES